MEYYAWLHYINEGVWQLDLSDGCFRVSYVNSVYIVTGELWSDIYISNEFTIDTVFEDVMAAISFVERRADEWEDNLYSFCTESPLVTLKARGA